MDKGQVFSINYVEKLNAHLQMYENRQNLQSKFKNES